MADEVAEGQGYRPQQTAAESRAALAREAETSRSVGRCRFTYVALLPGDLLPQNLLWDILGTGGVSVIDWECARIGDPAYDLAVVTRGARKPLQETGGLPLLLDFYNAAAGTALATNDVRVHELLLHLRWLAESGRDEAKGTLQGHGPLHYAGQVASLLRRSGA